MEIVLEFTSPQVQPNIMVIMLYVTRLPRLLSKMRFTINLINILYYLGHYSSIYRTMRLMRNAVISFVT